MISQDGRIYRSEVLQTVWIVKMQTDQECVVRRTAKSPTPEVIFFEVFLRLFLIPQFLVVVYLPWEVKERLCVRGLSCRAQVEE